MKTRMVAKPLTFSERLLANAVLKAAKRAYAKPEIRADFERWQKEREGANENHRESDRADA